MPKFFKDQSGNLIKLRGPARRLNAERVNIAVARQRERIELRKFIANFKATEDEQVAKEITDAIMNICRNDPNILCRES